MSLISCPGCARQIDLPNDEMGLLVECSECGERFRPPLDESDELPAVAYSPSRKPALIACAATAAFAGVFLIVALNSGKETAKPPGPSPGPVARAPEQARLATQRAEPPPAAPVPSPDPKPPKGAVQDWSHKELIAHLRSKGLQLEADAAETGSANGPAMYFFPPGKQHVRRILDGPGAGVAAYWVDVAYVQKRKSAEEAKDRAGVLEEGFAWGRFVFMGDPLFLDKIRRALP